ncbi:MAG: ATPase [Pseudomonadota bacterium]
MIYPSAEVWREAPRKRVALFGMSGVGKTHIARMLRDGGGWFHYSVDFRIGTRYMGEEIVDTFKRAAMGVPLLRDLLMSDSIYIASNISFENLTPLSTYLGKPGDPAKGGIPFEEYIRRQRQHRAAEIAATLDTLTFAEKADGIYRYPHLICDTSGSLCEVVDPEDPNDPVLAPLSREVMLVWIEGTEDDVEALSARFDRAPKPMYYNEDFLRAIWAEFLAQEGCTADEVDPDAFIRWGFRRMLAHRLPIYRAIARNWGITIPAAKVAEVRDAHDFEDLIASALPNG